jgi:uncharacterized protein (TIGR00369 family)
MDKQPSSRACFLCGRDNPVGLHMAWYNDDAAGQIRAEVIVPARYNGYPGIVHGGIVAAILDETSGRAVLLEGSAENLMVTAKLEVRYRRPTPTETPLAAVGWVVTPGRNRAEVAAEIRLPDGTVTAECRAVVLRPPAQVFDAWSAELPYWRVDP